MTRPSPTQPSRAPSSLVLAALLAACASPPPTTPPAELGVAVPATWSTPTAPATNLLPADWWRTFGDAQLDRLMAAAFAGNFDLRAATARLEAAVAARTIAGAPLLPELDAGFDAQRSRRLFLGFPFGGGGVPSSTTTTFGLSLSMRWELDLWGRVRAGDAAALADQAAAVAALAGARLSLTAQVCRAWFAAVEAGQQLQLAEATVAAFRATSDDVQDRFRRGLRPALDVHLAATNLANAEANVSQRRDQLQRARRQLDVLAGRFPDGRAELATTLPALPDAVPAGLPGELLQRRPDLVAAERRVAAAGCRVEQARAALFPRLALTASGGTSSTELADLVDDDFRLWSLGANLLQPLFRNGALRADVAQRAARRAEALAQYGNTVLRAFAEVENTLAATTQLDDRRRALAAAARHATAARDLARERWQRGITDFLAVADGQRQAFQAESALLTIERQRLENRIDLVLALGGGFAATAEECNP